MIKTILFLLLFNQVSGSDALEDLKILQWKNRIVVLNEVENQAEVLERLKVKNDAITERHILWFVLRGEKTLSNYSGTLVPSFAKELRNRYQLKQNQVILIGKDGGLKSDFDGINLNAIFLDIDAMPMRQREMQGQ